MDFGISRSITAKVDNGATRGLTRVGEVVGTAEYMSPEQASSDVVDGRSDLYSLGLVALFALTGRPAITGESTQQILVKQLTETPPPATSLRVVWLGPPGRWFVSFSSRNITPHPPEKRAPGLARVRANVNIASTGRAAAPVVAVTTTPTDRMRSLEDRVAALERWRDGAST